MDSSAPPVLDAQVLAGLREYVDDTMIERLVAQCLSTVAERLTAARHALVHGHAQDVAYEAHALKTSAGIIGALRLQRLADELYAAAVADDTSAMSRLLAAAEQALPATAGAVERARQRLAP